MTMTVLKVESTKAKSGFAHLPAQARSNDVAITRHGRVQAYVVSPDRYQSLTAVAEVDRDALQRLQDEFDTLVAGMQGTAHARAVDAVERLPLGRILAEGALKTGARSAKVKGGAGRTR